MKQMKRQFIELLNIYGVSSKEKKVRQYLIPILNRMMDNVYVDNYGNLLSEKKVGNGNGATIMLSAHMDTVKGVLKDRKIIMGKDTIRSNKGALGADDRGGIAIILTVLRNLHESSFNGTLKIAFSREEEIGCIGASKINPQFYKDVDLAIVVDRRGNRDIVTGCLSPFCSNSVGNFMQNVSGMIDMDWECVEGGISDAMTFSGNGINSVNISAGYYNEHTANEYASLSDMRDSVHYILQMFAIVNDFYKTFGSVPLENKWVRGYDSMYGSYGYYEDEFIEDLWSEVESDHGYCYAYSMGDDIIISQDSDEIILSRKELGDLISQMSLEERVL